MRFDGIPLSEEEVTKTQTPPASKSTPRFGGVPLEPGNGSIAMFKNSTKQTPSPSTPGKDFLTSASDVALGLQEAPITLATGIGSFLAGLPVASSKFIEGVLMGEPVKGLEATTDELYKFMKAYTYKPKSKFAETIGGVAASPYNLGHEFLSSSFRDRAWVKSLPKADQVKLSKGELANPKKLKEEYLRRNPYAGVSEGKAAQAVFDYAVGLLPMLKGWRESKAPIKEGAPREFTKASPTSTLSPEDKLISEALKSVDPKITDESINELLTEAKSKVKKTPTPKITTPAEAKVPSNQHFVDRLMEESVARKGYAKGAYLRLAKKVAELDVDAGEVDLGTLVKTKTAKTRALLEKLLKERDRSLEEEKQQGVPVGHSEQPSMSTEKPLKAPVTFIGLQENLPGKPPIVMVNDESGSTLVYNPAKHEIVNSEDLKAAMEGGGEQPSTAEVKASAKKSAQVEPTIPVDQKEPLSDVPIETAKSTDILKPKIKSYDSKELLSKDFEVGSEIPEKQAYAEASNPEGPEFGVAKVGDKYYRTVKKPDVGKQRSTPDAPDNEIVVFDGKNISIESPKKGRTLEDLIRIHKEWLKKREAKLKESKVLEGNSHQKKPDDLAPVDQDFMTFPSREAAQRYAEAAGVDRSILTDPLTGRSYFEPGGLPLEEFKKEGMHWDEGEPEALDDYGAVDEGGGLKDLVDIFNNERGSVDIDPLIQTIRRLRALNSAKEKLHLGFEELGKMLDMSPEGIAALKKSIGRLPELERKLKKELVRRLKNPTTQDKERVVEDVLNGLATVTKSAKEANDQFLEFLKSRGRVVDDYKKGSLSPPDRQRPLIDSSIPTLRKGFKDIVRLGESPHNTLRRAFDLEFDPVIDALEAQTSYIRNVDNMREWAKDLLKDVKSSRGLLKKRLLPLYNKYGNVLMERVDISNRIHNLETRIKKTAKTNKGLVKTLKSRLESLKIEREKLDKDLVPLVSGYDRIITSLAKESPDVRIALAAGEELPEGVTLSPKELKIAGEIRHYLDKSMEDLEKVGIPVIKSRTYFPRLFGALSKDKAIPGFLRRFTKSPDVLRFMHQLPESRIWTPSATTILDKYIPMVERKIAYQRFLNRWSEFINSRQYPNLQRYMTEWVNKNLYKKGNTLVEDGLGAVVTLEYARLIGLSLSTGFKHLFKMPNTLIRYDAVTDLKAISGASKIPIQAAMKRLGVKGRTTELRLFKAYVNSRALVKALDETPTMRNLSKSANMVKLVLGQPIIAVEALDNGVSVLAGIIAGGKKGTNFYKVQRALWNTILDANFRGGWDQPLWLKTPGSRALAMFQSTPFKLLEYKVQLMERALKGERDAFGTHYGTMLVRYVGLIGLAEVIARANDTSILDLVFHIPLFNELTKGPTFPPVLDWWKNMADKGVTEGTKEHLKYWGTVSKVAKVKKDRYPRRYYSSPTKYIFGLKKLGWKKGRRRRKWFPGTPKTPRIPQSP